MKTAAYSLFISVVKIKQAACANCLDLKFEAINKKTNTVTFVVFLVCSIKNHLNTL